MTLYALYAAPVVICIIIGFGLYWLAQIAFPCSPFGPSEDDEAFGDWPNMDGGK